MELDSLTTQICDYSHHMRGYTLATIRRFRTTLTIFRNATGIRSLAECTEDGVRTFFYRGRMERHWSPNTFGTYQRSLLVFFRWCVKNGHLGSNPAEGIEVPKAAKALPKRLPKQEADRLLEGILNYPGQSPFERARNHAIFATFLLAGLRRQELLSLHVVDVDLVGRTILVRQGKGNKDRFIPILPRLLPILGHYLDERVRASKTCPELFTALKRDAGLTNGGLKWLVAFARRATGMRFGVHQLRHSFATLMLEGGCDIFALSQMMGHSDIKTTTIYLAATAEHLRAQMAKHPLNYRW
jgi:site-specific recombinase XerD